MPAHPPLSPWPARLAYAAALLAVVWFFQHKMAEQARLHRLLTEVAPLAVEVVEEGNRETYKGIVSETYFYALPISKGYMRKAWIALQEVRKFSETSIPEQKKFGKKPSAILFQERIADMESLSDILWHTCDTFPEISEAIQTALPFFSETLQRQLSSEFSRLSTDDAHYWTALLQLRAQLAGATAINYCFMRVMGISCWVFQDPLLSPVQTCPKVGDIFKATIYLPSVKEVSSIYGYAVTVNGEPCREYKHRFDTPGRHSLSVLIEARDPWDTTLVTAYTRDFEVYVRPR